MHFQCTLTPGAEADLQFFRAAERRVILEAIRAYLRVDANVESSRRKRLRPNQIAPWELRVGAYRVFYTVEVAAVVEVIAIGYKEHNDLFIRGRKVTL